MNVTTDNQFAAALKTIRERNGLSARDVAEGSGLTDSGIRKIESGLRRPSLATALKISGYLSEVTGESLVVISDDHRRKD